MSKDSYRFDGRSAEEFKTSIQIASNIQKHLVSEWAAELAYRGLNIEVLPYAKGEDGAYLDRPNSDVDYLIRKLDGQSDVAPLEVKTNPKGVGPKSYCTYKVSDLKAVIKQNATILLICGVDTKSRDPAKIDLSAATWALIPPDQTARILLYTEQKKYGMGCMGNKLCVRVPEDQYNLYWTTERFTLYSD